MDAVVADYKFRNCVVNASTVVAVKHCYASISKLMGRIPLHRQNTDRH